MNLPSESITITIMLTCKMNKKCKNLEKYPKIQQKRKHF